MAETTIGDYRVLKRLGSSKRFRAFVVESRSPRSARRGTLYLMKDEVGKTDVFTQTVDAIRHAWPFASDTEQEIVLPEVQLWKGHPWFVVPDSLPIAAAAERLGEAAFASLGAQLRWLEQFRPPGGGSGFAHGDVRKERIALFGAERPLLIGPGWVAAADFARGERLTHARGDDVWHLARLWMSKSDRSFVPEGMEPEQEENTAQLVGARDAVAAAPRAVPARNDVAVAARPVPAPKPVAAAPRAVPARSDVATVPHRAPPPPPMEAVDEAPSIVPTPIPDAPPPKLPPLQPPPAPRAAKPPPVPPPAPPSAPPEEDVPFPLHRFGAADAEADTGAESSSGVQVVDRKKRTAPPRREVAPPLPPPGLPSTPPQMQTPSAAAFARQSEPARASVPAPLEAPAPAPAPLAAPAPKPASRTWLIVVIVLLLLALAAAAAFFLRR